MDVLISDTSVVIDLERAELIEHVFALPYRFVVPDTLYENEIKDYGGERLCALGLEVRTLTGAQVTDAQRLRLLERRISIHDSYALSLARAEAAILLAGDMAMRRLAEAEEVRCHGVLWVFDRLEEHKVVGAAALHAGLSRVVAHPRCWLPRDMVDQRLRRYGIGE
jgi:predicted nucleic acid-binding protein